MRLIFMNVGWMANYNGIEGDSIENGGSYNKENIGLEVCNFSDNLGFYLGFVQAGHNVIKLEKIGASMTDESISGVTVVWTATAPHGGTVVVGWYANATVYRYYQKNDNPSKVQSSNGVKYYNVKAKVEDSVLLPLIQRHVLIPRAVKGGIGMSNVWYANKPESQHIVKRVDKFIEDYAKGLNRQVEMEDRDYHYAAVEGRPRLMTHLVRERDSKLVLMKKQAVKNKLGRLACEVCDFDFEMTFGDIGKDFCEVHHLSPLMEMDKDSETTLDDLAIVCSNCHRMIHRSSPIFSIEKMKRIFNGHRS